MEKELDRISDEIAVLVNKLAANPIEPVRKSLRAQLRAKRAEFDAVADKMTKEELIAYYQRAGEVH